MMKSIKVKAEFEIPEERVKCLLCCAFEGGSNYWYRNLEPVLRADLKRADFSEGGKMQGDTYYHWSQLVPFVEGCHLAFSDCDGNKHTLDLPKIIRGLEIMAKKYPHHYTDFLSENDDADTGDVFLQCCVFEDIVYG